MRDFSKFSEAAVLYAENVPVVERMAVAMHESIAEFVESLTYRLDSLFQPHKLITEIKRGYRAFALETWDRPYVAFYQNRHEVVRPGRLVIYVHGPYPTTSTEDVERLLRLARSTPLRTFDLTRSEEIGPVLETTIQYGEANPVDVIAGAIREILRYAAVEYGVNV